MSIYWFFRRLWERRQFRLGKKFRSRTGVINVITMTPESTFKPTCPYQVEQEDDE